MEYTKPPLTFEQQADQLIERGLVADKVRLIQTLKAVNYYRLSGYLYPFRQKGDRYLPGTSLDVIWRRYTFDRQLRILVMDAIERVEVAVRTQLVFHFSNTYGPFGYLDSKNLPMLERNKYDQWLQRLKEEVGRSKEVFVTHFKAKYGDSHEMPPFWMLAELMSFGSMLTLYRGINSQIKKQVAKEYQIPDKVLDSWLISLNGSRNICAHHGRLWNRILGYKPKIPYENKYPEWHRPIVIGQDKIFVILTILRFMLKKVAPHSKWPVRFNALLKDYQEIPIDQMGFSVNWQNSLIWQEY